MYQVIAIASIDAALEAATAALRARMLDLVDEGQVEPTWDGKRYHAPCDHYVFDGVSYAGGQFLHDPIDRGGHVDSREKILIQASVKDEFGTMIRKWGTEVNFGKTWESDGMEMCYAYITGPQRIVSRVAKMVPGKTRTLCESRPGLDLGKTWETTLGKLKQKLYYFTSYGDGIEKTDPELIIEEELDRKIINWALSDKKKTVKVTVGYKWETSILGSSNNTEIDLDAEKKLNLLKELNQKLAEIAELEVAINK